MSKAGLKVTAIVAVLTLLTLAYFVLTFETPQGTTTLVIPPPASPRAEPDAAEATTSTLQCCIVTGFSLHKFSHYICNHLFI